MTFDNSKQPFIPRALVYAQCVTFAALYGIWMIYELLYFRRILLISGAILSLYPIYHYRAYFLQKRAIPIWLIVGLFLWMIFHLFFLAQDYPAQLLELRRIWKYAGLGAIFALGLGLSLASSEPKNRKIFWMIFYFGLCLPVLIHLCKYVLTTYGVTLGLIVPAFLSINVDSNTAFYIPKTDYIAFCLPVLALSLGQILRLLSWGAHLHWRQYLAGLIYLLNISATLFLFSVQNTKNGIVYSAILIGLFLILVLIRTSSVKLWPRLLLLVMVGVVAMSASYSSFQKNDSWRTLIADTKVGFRLEQYPQWKFAGEQGYPNNEYGKTVSVTNYERAAWSKVGIGLAVQSPLGYGLVEDSFKNMVKKEWPEASPHLSHSHSGWLDLILGLGFPGFICIFLALLLNIWESNEMAEPWKSVVFWALVANLMLWVTTEVAATVSFSALLFWVSLSSGLPLKDQVQAIKTAKS